MTKADKTRHETWPELLPTQEQAVGLFVAGKRDGEVAEAVGASRQTVNGWRLHDPAFRAALNQARREVWDATTDRLRTLVTKALDRAEKEIDGENGADVALALLKLLNVGNVDLRAYGPFDPATIEDIEDREAAERTERRELEAMLGGTRGTLESRVLQTLKRHKRMGALD